MFVVGRGNGIRESMLELITLVGNIVDEELFDAYGGDVGHGKICVTVTVCGGQAQTIGCVEETAIIVEVTMSDSEVGVTGDTVVLKLGLEIVMVDAVVDVVKSGTRGAVETDISREDR